MTAANGYAGEVPVTIGGQACILLFDYAALAKLHAAFGEQYPLALERALGLGDVSTIAAIASIGLHARNPMTAEEVMAASPPLVPFAEAISKAFAYAWWGPRAQPSAEDLAEGKQQGHWLLARLVTLWKWQSARRNGSASPSASSGG